VPPEIQSQDHAIQAMQTSITTFQSSVIARLNTEYAEMNERLTATEEDTERRLTEMEEKIDAMQGHKIDAMQGHTPNVSQQRSRRPQQKDSAFVKGMKNLYGDTARSQTVQSEEDSQSAKHSFYFVDVRQLQAALKNSKTNPVVLLETVGASISDATKASISDATKASISDATKASISEATKKYLPDIDETAITKYTRQKDGWSYSHFIQTPYQILATPDFNPDHIFEFLETKKSQFLHVFAAKPVEHIGQFWAQLTAYQHPITVLWYTEEPMDIANLVLDHADSARQLALYNSWNVGDQ
jgi:TolA-binding protein